MVCGQPKEDLNLEENKRERKAVLEKIAEILSAAQKPLLKSQIMQKCQMCSAYANVYFKQLIQSGLLDIYPADTKHLTGSKLNRRVVYQTSRKGIEFLKCYEQLIALMSQETKSVACGRVAVG
jgi:predicted transcriptional regulator